MIGVALPRLGMIVTLPLLVILSSLAGIEHATRRFWLAAGVSFTLRDLVQDRMGRSWTVAAIGAGALLSLAVSDARFAVASGLAFLASETADMLVYSPLKRRTWLGAVFASNVVGLALDSALFLLLAFGSLDFLAGQIVGKLEMTVLTVAVLWLWRRRDLPVSDRADRKSVV